VKTEKIQPPVETYDLGLLESHTKRWAESSSLRWYYQNLWSNALDKTRQPILEIGSGICAIKKVFPEVTTSDLGGNKLADLALDAYELHTLEKRFSTLLAIDVLHHLTHPFRFLESCAAHLPKTGQLILIEPAATCFGKWFYRCFHHEPCVPGEILPPYKCQADKETGRFANMGMAWALFIRDKQFTYERLSRNGLKLQSIRFFDFLGYPLTGGFSGPAWVPDFIVRTLLYCEKYIPQFLMRKMGLRMKIVLERIG